MSNLHHLDLNILYIEDENDVRESIQRVLELTCKNVYVASNGIEALKYFNNNTPIDIIVTDIRMPKMGGLEFIQVLKAKYSDIPVIITTAFNEIEYLTKAIELKVEKFVHKPINIQELIADIKKLSDIILNQKELARKKNQLENYRKAIRLTNYIVEIKPNGEIKTISKNLRQYFFENFSQNFKLKDIISLLPPDLSATLFEKVTKFEIYTKDVVLTLEDKIHTFNLTAFASDVIGLSIQTISIILKDLTHIVEEKDKEISRLYLDQITKLPNRHALIQELNEEETHLCLMIISIDEFKKYRHTYGYKIADKILTKISEELRKYSWNQQRTHTIYKLEEELFAITITKLNKSDLDYIKQVTKEIVKYFHAFVVNIGELSIDVTVTVGTSCTHSGDLLLESLIALDSANSMKKYSNCFEELKNPQEQYKNNILMQQKVKKALDKDQVIPYFQPIVDKEQQIVKYEALARVIDPDDNGTMISPASFLEVIKDSKNYEKFTKTIIKKSLDVLELLSFPISINLSFEDITNPRIIHFLEEQLQAHPNSSVTLELLESEGLQDMEQTRKFCTSMQKYGAKIAIDDFGSGYSNYDYFFEIPMDILKIDGSLIKKINEYKGYLLLESIVTFAKKLNIELVAEYVEDEVTFEKLRLLGIDFFQGYYFGKPQSPENIVKQNLTR
jgi:c-di-GMP phosphodiesterase